MCKFPYCNKCLFPYNDDNAKCHNCTNRTFKWDGYIKTCLYKIFVSEYGSSDCRFPIEYDPDILNSLYFCRSCLLHSDAKLSTVSWFHKFHSDLYPYKSLPNHYYHSDFGFVVHVIGNESILLGIRQHDSDKLRKVYTEEEKNLAKKYWLIYEDEFIEIN
jgi:hypothetical protein